MCTQDWLLFIIGFLVGLVIMLILLWLVYGNRLFFFAYCPYEKRLCGAQDYHSTPEQAIASGYNADDIILKSGENLIYRRQLKDNTCIPARDQDIRVSYPQYCSLRLPDGSNIEVHNTSPGSSEYLSDDGRTFILGENCSSLGGSRGLVSGSPIAKWRGGIYSSSAFV